MKMNPMKQENLESVLLEFHIEAGEQPKPSILDLYCRRYPQFARELTDYALEWLVDKAMEAVAPVEAVATAPSSPLVSRAISRLYDRIREKEAGEKTVALAQARADSPFKGMPVLRKRAISKQLGIDMPLFAKFQNRLIDPDSVPSTFLSRLAKEVEHTVERLLGYLRLPVVVNAAADFRAEGKPAVGGAKERFEDAVRRSSLDEKQKQALLKG
jgi:hypothetical protein